MSRPTAEQQIQFLVKIQRLLNEGTFVATYKFALLQALADLSVEKGDDSGDPLEIRTRDIAKKFIQYYAPQALPFPSPGRTPEVLKQNPSQQAEVIGKLVPLVAQVGTNISKLRKSERLWNPLETAVNRKIKEDPLWRLQILGNDCDDFLYENSGEYVNVESITLREGVVYNFRQFHILILDLIRGAWIRHIRTIKANDQILGQTKNISDFLFGSERENLTIYRDFLKDIQSGACFYCRDHIPGAGEVDHFIPWVKYPVDLGHNFVLAHPKCNNAKRDYLAAENHLGNWFERNNRHFDDMKWFFGDQGIINDLSSSNQVTRWAYEQAENASAHVWVMSGETQPIGQSYINWRSFFEQDHFGLEEAADRE